MAARRMFCALMLGAELGRELARPVARALEPAARGLRPVPPADLHVTLHFAGLLEPADGSAVQAALAGTLAGARAPRLRIAGPDAFGARGRERVLVARVEDTADPGGGLLAELAERAAAAARAAGLAPPPGRERPFAPHVTLARVRSPRRGTRARVPEAFYALNFGFEWQPSRAAWVESPGGGLGYRVVAEFPLASESG